MNQVAIGSELSVGWKEEEHSHILHKVMVMKPC